MDSAPQKKKNPTVADVAAAAGVSPGTVSKALNGRGALRQETREKVLAAAEALGFQPNLVARGLLTGRSYIVGVLTTDSIGRFTIPLLTGAEDALGAGQMSMLLCESRGDPIREQHYLGVLLARRVDGIIVTGRSSDRRPSLGRHLPVPVVYALAQSDDPEDLSILHDDEDGAAQAVRHLLDTGRRRIAHVTGPPSQVAVQHRLAGVERALAEAGEPLVADGPLFGEWSEAWGREAAQRLLRSGAEFDGVFCASDQIARGLSDGLRESGVDVPRQVGVVGVDNWDVMVDGARPPLTTVDLQLAELGNVAATRLLAAIDGKPVEGGVERVPCRLIQRQSTALA
ncbi:LacI family DNA-binding transcriptional regulator [uncultured Leifsonia sp.]|uniref:LacI family DNA-binding transcriptional regulator n=1 Tax=uncultured Leifsonia sp. TaxID=340359 RepID=UPI0025FD1ACC|nr:LacI family DNA-binding transcriptional regulator [uncultured Leifsonia sp.]